MTTDTDAAAGGLCTTAGRDRGLLLFLIRYFTCEGLSASNKLVLILLPLSLTDKALAAEGFGGFIFRFVYLQGQA